MSNLPKTSITFNCNHCPKPPYPKNKNGQPFSGNTNNQGSSITGKMRCAHNILHSQRPQLKIVNKPVNQFKSRVGAPGGSGAPPKNAF